jgi:hypothetical protein
MQMLFLKLSLIIYIDQTLTIKKPVPTEVWKRVFKFCLIADYLSSKTLPVILTASPRVTLLPGRNLPSA